MSDTIAMRLGTMIPPPVTAPKDQASTADTTAATIPHLINHAVVRTTHVAVRTALAGKRDTQRGGSDEGRRGSSERPQSDGFDDIRAVPRPSRALKNASPCAMRMTNALDTGGGRHEEMYEKMGLRDSLGRVFVRGPTFDMTGCAGGGGRGVAKYCE